MFRIPALPYEYEVPSLSQLALVIIDMQRDFLEPGGFGEMLGNDVTQLGSIVPTLEELLDFCRQLEIAG
ncbi:cysteine hydrolase, partial [Synechococcus sp. R8-2]